jgi:hypothetical protein
LGNLDELKNWEIKIRNKYICIRVVRQCLDPQRAEKHSSYKCKKTFTISGRTGNYSLWLSVLAALLKSWHKSNQEKDPGIFCIF